MNVLAAEKRINRQACREREKQPQTVPGRAAENQEHEVSAAHTFKDMKRATGQRSSNNRALMVTNDWKRKAKAKPSEGDRARGRAGKFRHFDASG